MYSGDDKENAVGTTKAAAKPRTNTYKKKAEVSRTTKNIEQVNKNNSFKNT